MSIFKQTTLIGIGLIGSSIARALKKKKLSKSVCIFSRKQRTINIAKKLKLGNFYTTNLKESVKNSDLIISGRYQQSLRNTYLRLRGSTNQKLIYPQGSRLNEESDGGNEMEIIIDELGSMTTLGYPEINVI